MNNTNDLPPEVAACDDTSVNKMIDEGSPLNGPAGADWRERHDVLADPDDEAGSYVEDPFGDLNMIARPAETIDEAHERLGHTAPRVTPADLEANIVDIEIVKHVAKSGQVLRWAVITTRSGFAVAGEPSASVSSANDSEELGSKYAIENARRALWPLMGYALRERLHEVALPKSVDPS